MNLLLQFCDESSDRRALMRQCRRHDRFEQRDRPADYCCDPFLCRTSTRVARPLIDPPLKRTRCSERNERLYSCLRPASASVLFFVRPIGGSSIRFCSSFSACFASMSNCFCSCLRLALVARSLAPAALSAHLRASCRRCSARVVITGRTLLAVGHRGGRRKNASRLQPAPGSNAKPLAWLRASFCSRPHP
jgi:hypothetical protein